MKAANRKKIRTPSRPYYGFRSTIREGPQKGATTNSYDLPCHSRPTQPNSTGPRHAKYGGETASLQAWGQRKSLEHLIPSRVNSIGGAHPVTPGSRYQH